MNKLNNLNELSILIAERVKHTLGPDELLKIESDALLRSIILDAAGHVIGVFFDQMRNNIKVNYNWQDTATLQETVGDVAQRLIEKALDDSTISQSIAILRAEQQKLKQDI